MNKVEIRDLLDAGLHFGHQTKRWNPAMKRFIFGAKNGVYIIDLSKTMAQLKVAQNFLGDVVSRGQDVLFVGTKRQAQDILKEGAEKSGQPYVVNRWLGGMLTNNKTVRQSVKRMRELQDMRDNGELEKLASKKEQSMLRRELEKLERNLTGIANMDRTPGALVIIDTCREHLAIAEAKRLNIPVVALVDTNADPDQIDFPIPGNDDSIRAIQLITDQLAGSVKDAYEIYSKEAKAKAEADAIKAAENKAAAQAAKEERKLQEKEEKKKREKALEAVRKKRAAEKAKELKEAEAAKAEEAKAPAETEAAPAAEEKAAE
ncbi:30S ribosomal protein S2 [Verrucomicrobiota bacterium]